MDLHLKPLPMGIYSTYFKTGPPRQSFFPTQYLAILQLILAGRTNKVIDAEIYNCEKTFEFHLDHI